MDVEVVVGLVMDSLSNLGTLVMGLWLLTLVGHNSTVLLLYLNEVLIGLSLIKTIGLHHL